MKLTKLIWGAAVAGAVTFGLTCSTLAIPSGYPLVKLSFSGSLTYTTNSTSGTNLPAQKIALKKMSFDTKSLIAKLNASPAVQDSISYFYENLGITIDAKGQVAEWQQKNAAETMTNIPSGSYFIWDPYEEQLYITNKNGFFFPLEFDDGWASWNYGSLEVNDSHLIGTYKYKSPWILSGSETDKTGVHFYFTDGNAFEVEIYGVATLNWTYGTPTSGGTTGTQKATVSVSITGNGNGDCYVDDYDAIPISFSASGSGTETKMPVNNQPFFYEYFEL